MNPSYIPTSYIWSVTDYLDYADLETFGWTCRQFRTLSQGIFEKHTQRLTTREDFDQYLKQYRPATDGSQTEERVGNREGAGEGEGVSNSIMTSNSIPPDRVWILSLGFNRPTHKRGDKCPLEYSCKFPNLSRVEILNSPSHPSDAYSVRDDDPGHIFWWEALMQDIAWTTWAAHVTEDNRDILIYHTYTTTNTNTNTNTGTEAPHPIHTRLDRAQSSESPHRATISVFIDESSGDQGHLLKSLYGPRFEKQASCSDAEYFFLLTCSWGRPPGRHRVDNVYLENTDIETVEEMEEGRRRFVGGLKIMLGRDNRPSFSSVLPEGLRDGSQS